MSRFLKADMSDNLSLKIQLVHRIDSTQGVLYNGHIIFWNVLGIYIYQEHANLCCVLLENNLFMLFLDINLYLVLNSIYICNQKINGSNGRICQTPS